MHINATRTSRLPRLHQAHSSFLGWGGWLAVLIGLLASGLLASVPAANALDVLPDEKASRTDCERRFCQIVLEGKENGPPLTCDMTKTWDRVKIKKNGEENALSWGFGDARCKVALKIPRSRIVPALHDKKHTFQFDRQTIDCKIEGADHTLNTLEVEAAPKIKFKNGHAYKVWINIKDVRGNSGLKTFVWTAAKLADGLGLFHSATIKEINKFIHSTCKARYANDAKNAAAGRRPLRADAH